MNYKKLSVEKLEAKMRELGIEMGNLGIEMGKIGVILYKKKKKKWRTKI